MANATESKNVKTLFEDPLSKKIVREGQRARVETDNGVILDLIVESIMPNGFVLSFPDSKPITAATQSVVAVSELPLRELKTGDRVHLKMDGKILPAIISLITKNGFILVKHEKARGRIGLTDLLKIAFAK